MFYFCEFNSFGGENVVVRFTEKFYGTSQLLKRRLFLIVRRKKILKGFIRFSVIELQSLKLRTVPTIVTAHIFCACQSSRARRERNAQHAGHADWFCLL